MLFLTLLTTALASPPMVDDVKLGEAVPATRASGCAPIGGNAFRCRAVPLTLAGVSGNLALEKCGDVVYGAKFVSLAVPGKGHKLDGAMQSENPLDDSRSMFDKLRKYFVDQGMEIPAPGEMGPASVDGKGLDSHITLMMGPVTDVPELPSGVWQSGFVLALDETCKAE